jgi:hypothetical protein
MRRAFMAAFCLVASAGWPLQCFAQSSGSSIVEEALKGVEQDQARDAERMRRLVEEAVKGTEQAPSGQEAVNPSAPDSLRPLTDEAPGALPVGYRAESLIDAPVRDGAGAEIGRIRGLGIDDASGAARAIVALMPRFGQPEKIAAVPVETLAPAAADRDGYVMDLSAVALEQLPAYTWRDSMWRRVDA